MSVESAIAKPFTKTMGKFFISKVDTADAQAVKLLLANPNLRAQVPGELGQHAIKNLDRYVPQTEAAVRSDLKYPAVAATSLQIDQGMLAGYKAILADLKEAGATLTDRLLKFLKG